MREASPKRTRRRRADRADDPRPSFYASYYGTEEPAGPPTRHRATTSRTGAAVVAGLAALTRRKGVVFAALTVAVVGVLAIGVMASATRTGSDPAHSPSLVDTTGSPTEHGGVVAAGTSSPAASTSRTAAHTSPGTRAGSSSGGSLTGNGPPRAAGPQSTPAAQPSASTRHSSARPAPPPATHHSPPPSTTHGSSTAPPPTSQPPTPSPTSTCKVPLTPTICLIKH